MSSLIFILFFISGADGVRTVSRLTVLAGGSVTIPCHYDQQYKPHVKYWCKGSSWNYCTPIVRTDSPQRNGKVAINDDPAQQVFTVTLSNLQEDFGGYWCTIEINNGRDIGAYLSLKVTTGTPDLSVVNNRMTGAVGGSVSVFCRYDNSLQGREKMWCRSGDWTSCLTAGKSETSQDRVHLDVNETQGLMTVIVRGLERNHTGWYWCAASDLQVPVHINVTEETPVSTVSTTTTQHGKSAFDNTIIFLMVIFGLLFLLVTIAVVSWNLWNRHKKTQAKRREANQSTRVTDIEYEVTYSTVVVKQEDTLNKPLADTSDDVTYSSIILLHREVSQTSGV